VKPLCNLIFYFARIETKHISQGKICVKKKNVLKIVHNILQTSISENICLYIRCMWHLSDVDSFG